MQVPLFKSMTSGFGDDQQTTFHSNNLCAFFKRGDWAASIRAAGALDVLGRTGHTAEL
jgi:hypothetical protein